jgi:hypothetical protein
VSPAGKPLSFLTPLPLPIVLLLLMYIAFFSVRGGSLPHGGDDDESQRDRFYVSRWRYPTARARLDHTSVIQTSPVLILENVILAWGANSVGQIGNGVFCQSKWVPQMLNPERPKEAAESYYTQSEKPYSIPDVVKQVCSSLYPLLFLLPTQFLTAQLCTCGHSCRSSLSWLPGRCIPSL